MKNYILLAVAVLAGILAFVISRSQILKEKQRLQSMYNTREVVAANKPLLKGDIIAKADLALLRMPQVLLTGSEIPKDKYYDLIGRKVAYDVDAKQPIRWRDVVVDSQQRGGSELAKLIRQDKQERALTIAVDVVSSVGNLVEPNDHIDLLATFRFPTAEADSSMDTVTLTLLQNVVVLATGQEVASQTMGGQQPGNRRGYSSITLAVTPKEAEMLVFAQQKGKLTCTLRHPEDVYTSQDIQDVDFAYLKDHLKAYMEERRARLGGE